MGKRNGGFKDLLAEVARLVGGVISERMESEEFHESLDEINRRMSDRYGCVIGAIGVSLKIVTMPMPGEKERGKKPELSLNLKFGGSPEDQKMKEEFGLDEAEMNQLLEQARGERVREEYATPAGAEAAPQPPEEAAETEEAAESADPRSISQIINSIREIARALNLDQRRLLAENLGTKWLKRRGIAITEEQMKNDTLWLQCVQNLINEIQQRRGRLKDLPEKMLFALLEGLFKKVSAE